MIAKTLPGLEQILSDELKEIGALQIRHLIRGVEFYGDQTILYKANYLCRTAIRILKPITSCKVNNEEDLYQQVKRINWPDYFRTSHTIRVDAGVHNANIRHSHYVALKTKDAIADRFRQDFGKRPSVDTDNPDFIINVHLNKNDCSISFDSSGTILYKREYRTGTGPAPLNEVLAAGMILLSGWDKKSNFVDPMCGSGTLLIEAAMIANNIPAGYYREHYGFMNWPDFNARLWQKIKKESGHIPQKSVCKIIGADISKEIIDTARNNIRNAGLLTLIDVKESAINKFTPPANDGVLITNPPYGERLVENDLIALYKEIGNVLKQKYTGYKAWIISSDMNALKFVGLKPSQKITLYNGQLECRFVKFELYEGSKKSKYS
ncbi:class I SAM-dependent RNA methyltransferase, partial [Bacteroidota bacterium]